jgi:DNA-binding NarL/FixJ family response regulator
LKIENRFPDGMICDESRPDRSVADAYEELNGLTAARASAPDLLISGVAMPGLSGVDLAIEIKAECPACKFLLFSGQATTRDLLKDARSQGNTCSGTS